MVHGELLKAVLVVASGLLALSGCAGSATEGPLAASTSTASVGATGPSPAVTVATSEQVFGDGQVTLAPPEPSQAPAHDAASVFAAWQQLGQGSGMWASATRVTVTFGVLSDRGSGISETPGWAVELFGAQDLAAGAASASPVPHNVTFFILDSNLELVSSVSEPTR